MRLFVNLHFNAAGDVFVLNAFNGVAFLHAFEALSL